MTAGADSGEAARLDSITTLEGGPKLRATTSCAVHGEISFDTLNAPRRKRDRWRPIAWLRAVNAALHLPCRGPVTITYTDDQERSTMTPASRRASLGGESWPG